MKKPTIRISLEAYKKIMIYTELAEKEVLGFLEIEEIEIGKEERYLLIKDVHLPEQTVTAGSCTPIEGAESKLLLELEKKGIDSSKIRGWWHKHPISTWSSIDNNTFEEWQKTRNYVVGLFTEDDNKKLVARVDLNIWGIKTSIDNINVEIDIPIEEELRRECKRELQRKIKEAIVQPTQYRGYQTRYPMYDSFWGRDVGLLYRNTRKEKNIVRTAKDDDAPSWVKVPDNWNAREHNNTCWLGNNIVCSMSTCDTCPLYREMKKEVEIYKKNGNHIYWRRYSS